MMLGDPGSDCLSGEGFSSPQLNTSRGNPKVRGREESLDPNARGSEHSKCLTHSAGVWPGSAWLVPLATEGGFGGRTQAARLIQTKSFPLFLHRNIPTSVIS